MIEENRPWKLVAVDDDSGPTEYRINFECEQKDSEISICVNSTSINDLDSSLQIFEQLLHDTYQCPDGLMWEGARLFEVFHVID